MNKTKKIYLESFYTLLLVFGVIILFPVIFNIGIFQSFEETLSDFSITDAVYSTLRDTEITLADTNIVIIDSEGLSKSGIAFILDKINENQPKVIGLDMIFDENNETLQDYSLANSIAESQNIVLAEELMLCQPSKTECDSLRTSNELFTQNTKSGFTNVLINKDKRYTTVRKFYPKYKVNDKTVYAFPVVISEMYDKGAVKSLFKRNNLKEIIYYRGNVNKFHFIEGLSIIKDGQDLDFIKDKIVLIGKIGRFSGYKLMRDLYFSPLNERYSGRTFPDLTRIEIHANIISTISEGNYVSVMPEWLGLLIAIIICYGNLIIFSYISIRNGKWFEIGSLLIFFTESILILFLTVHCYSSYLYQLKLTTALLASAISVFAYQVYNESFKTIVSLISNKVKLLRG